MSNKFKCILCKNCDTFSVLKVFLWIIIISTVLLMPNVVQCTNVHHAVQESTNFLKISPSRIAKNMPPSDSTWITPTHLCDGVACKCGYQLVLCQCVNQIQRIVVKPNEIKLGVSNLTITDCQVVHFQTRSIKNITSLRSLNIHNVKHLQIDEKSLEWDGDGITFIKPETVDFPKLSIRITNTNIPNVSRYAFNGNIREIVFEHTQLGKIQNFAFSNLNGNEKIHFKNSRVDQIHVQGFKKFTTNYLLIENTTFQNDLISRTFSDIEVRSILRISDHSRFQTIKPSAFIVTNPFKIEVADSHFQVLDSEAFKVFVRGDALFRDNIIDTLNSNAFVSITANRVPKLDFIFTNNTVSDLREHSFDFNTTSFNVKLYAINLNILCSCENIEKWTKWISSAITDLRSISCLNDQKNRMGQTITLDMYKNKYCSTSSKTLKIIAIVTILIVAIIIIIVLIYLYMRYRYDRTHKKQWINNASPILARKSTRTSNNESTTTADGSKNSTLKYHNGKLPMIVPDGRTYRETIVVVEQADLLTTEL